MRIRLGQTKTLRGSFRTWDNQPVDPVDPTCRVIDSDSGVQVAAGPAVQDSVGEWHYDWAPPMDCPLGVGQVRFSGLVDGAMLNDGFPLEVVSAYPLAGVTASLLCTPWSDTVTRCDPDNYPEGLLARAFGAAQDMIHVALGYRYPGVCRDVIRACSPACGQQWLDYPSDSIGGSRPIGASIGQGCGGRLCNVGAYVTLTNLPVVSVERIVVDGVDLHDGSWRIIDDRLVAPVAQGVWPSCSRSLEVHYTWGAAVSEAIVMAAEVYACELASGWSGGACRLPKRVQQVTAENITQIVIDPMEFLDEFGRFGLPEVDSVIKTFNPHGLDRDAKMVSPQEYARRNHRVR